MDAIGARRSKGRRVGGLVTPDPSLPLEPDPPRVIPAAATTATGSDTPANSVRPRSTRSCRPRASTRRSRPHRGRSSPAWRRFPSCTRSRSPGRPGARRTGAGAPTRRRPASRRTRGVSTRVDRVALGGRLGPDVQHKRLVVGPEALGQLMGENATHRRTVGLAAEIPTARGRGLRRRPTATAGSLPKPFRVLDDDSTEPLRALPDVLVRDPGLVDDRRGPADPDLVGDGPRVDVPERRPEVF